MYFFCSVPERSQNNAKLWRRKFAEFVGKCRRTTCTFLKPKDWRIKSKLVYQLLWVNITSCIGSSFEFCLFFLKVSPHCLLPDTVCSECSENVDNFYSFIKNCLQNIIILEAQYDIHESCLKTKRKHEKGSLTDSGGTKFDKNIQTDEDFSDIIYFKEKSISFSQKLAEVERILTNNDIDFDKFNLDSAKNGNKNVSLVDYEVESECSDTEAYNAGKVELVNKNENFTYTNNSFQAHLANKQYFADTESSLIDEITQRKNFKRKNDEILPNRTKIFKMDPINRRKSKQPKKFQNLTYPINHLNLWNFNNMEEIMDNNKIEQNNTQVRCFQLFPRCILHVILFVFRSKKKQLTYYPNHVCSVICNSVNVPCWPRTFSRCTASIWLKLFPPNLLWRKRKKFRISWKLPI